MAARSVFASADLTVSTSPTRPLARSPALSAFLSLPLLLALMLGGLLAGIASVSPRSGIVALLALGGLAGAALWLWARWPVAPILRVALVASFSFRSEVNLFPVFKYHENPPGLNISLMLITSLALLGAHFVRRLKGKPRRKVYPLSFAFVAAVMWVWCALSVLDGAERLLGFYGWWNLSATLLMCFVVANEFADRESLRAVVITFAIAIGLNGLIGLLQSAFGTTGGLAFLGAVTEENQQPVGEDGTARASGLLQMANAFGWYLATYLPMLLAGLILRAPVFGRRARTLLAVATGLGVMGLILTYARGSWAAFGATMIVLSALAYRALPVEERGRYAMRVSGLAIVAALLCLPFTGSIYTRLTEDDQGAAYSRVPLMEVAQTMIEDNPLLGVGLSSYEAEMRRYDKTPDRISDTFDWPVHNIYLHMTAEGGIPATFCFLALIAIALGRGWRTMKSRDPFLRALALGFVVGLLAYLWTGMKELGSFGSPQLRYCFLLVGLLLAIDRANRSFEEFEEKDAEGVMIRG